MKVTIRQGVFETNSSSMHALAMQKDFNLNCEQCKEIYKDLIPDHISFKFETTEQNYVDGSYYDYSLKKRIKYDKKGITASKIILIYANIIGRMYAASYGQEPKYGYINLTQFFSWVNKLGVTYDIQYQPTMFWCENTPMNKNDAYFSSLVDDELWEHMYDATEETFCNFLFGDGSCLDGYETDCMPRDYEKFENDFWDKLTNKGKCQTFEHYGG